MTVPGHDIILNCRKCFGEIASGTRLQKNGDCFECPRCKSRYKVNGDGFLTRL